MCLHVMMLMKQIEEYFVKTDTLHCSVLVLAESGGLVRGAFFVIHNQLSF